jgi:hypothetical protein
VLDDNILIVNNKFTQQGFHGIRDIFAHESFTGYFGEQQEMVAGGRYRPLSIATFAVEKSVTGGNKIISHFINVLLYAFTGILFYRVLVLMFASSKTAAKGAPWFFTIPFVAAILFITHPLHVEVVANVKGRDELFALLGELGAIYFTFKYFASKSWTNLIYSGICFFLGILSKESVITFLFIIPLTSYFFSTSTVSAKLKIMMPIVAATFVYVIVRYNVLGYLLPQVEITNVMNNPFYGMTLGERTATILYTLLLYLKLLVLPYPLTSDYYPYHIPVMKWDNWEAILSLLVYVSLIVVALKTFRKKTWWSYCIFFFLVTASIISNLFVSVGTFMGERFMYQPSVGFFIAAGCFLVIKGSRTLLMKRISLGAFIVASFAFAFITLQRLPDWKNDDTLGLSALRVSSNSANANFYYGLYLWNHIYQKLPKDVGTSRRISVLDSVQPYFEKAARIVPSYYYANSFEVGVAVEYNRLDHDYVKLIKTFEEVNRTGTYEPLVLGYLGQVNAEVTDVKDARLLSAFYSRMVEYYKANFPTTTQPSDYQALLKEINDRLPKLEQASSK